MQIVTLYVTHKNKEEAKKISDYLLSKRLIACTNFFPIRSSYWWKGNIEEASEIVTLFKTTRENLEKAKEEIIKVHPYETPCILTNELEANESYARWIHNEVQPITNY